MPVEFLSDEQAARYGRYHADPSPEQLARFFYLSPQDIRFLADYRRSYTQLGCAVQPGTLRFLGTFLPVPTPVPAVVVQTLAQQLHLTADTWCDQYTRPNTLHDHQVQVVPYLGFHPFDGRQSFRLTRWLYAQVLTSTVRPSVLFDLATAHLVGQRVVLPGATVLARLTARVRERTGPPTPLAPKPCATGGAGGPTGRATRWAADPTRSLAHRAHPRIGSRLSGGAGTTGASAGPRGGEYIAPRPARSPLGALGPPRLARLGADVGAHGRRTPPGNDARFRAGPRTHGARRCAGLV